MVQIAGKNDRHYCTSETDRFNENGFGHDGSSMWIAIASFGVFLCLVLTPLFGVTLRGKTPSPASRHYVLHDVPWLPSGSGMGGSIEIALLNRQSSSSGVTPY
jgi:hypothetical protein